MADFASPAKPLLEEPIIEEPAEFGDWNAEHQEIDWETAANPLPDLEAVEQDSDSESSGEIYPWNEHGLAPEQTWNKEYPTSEDDSELSEDLQPVHFSWGSNSEEVSHHKEGGGMEIPPVAKEYSWKRNLEKSSDKKSDHRVENVGEKYSNRIDL